MSIPPAEKLWVPLTSRERRVVGVMVEKQKTTPEYYPMTVAAIVTASNQKSNRDPVVNYDSDDVEETLQALRKKGAVVMIEGSGRVAKWKHTLYEWFGLRNRPVEMAVLAELLLRGRQTEGDLRARAARMEPIPDLDALQLVIKNLQSLDLVLYLTPPEVRRGAIVTHNLYSPNELEQERLAFSRQPQVVEDEPRPSRAEPRPPADTGWKTEAAELRAEVETLRTEVSSLRSELQALKTLLGA